jgi:MFS family permease
VILWARSQDDVVSELTERSFFGLGRDNLLIMLSMALWGSGDGMWYYIQPLYVKSLGATSLQIGFVLSLAPVLMVLGFIPVGILADRYGRKKTILGGSVAGTVAVLLLAAAHDWRQSIIGFVLYYGSGCCLPAIHAYVAHGTPHKDLNRIFTVLYSAFAVGLIIFPTIGGWLAGRAGFAPVFLVAGLFYGLSTLAVARAREQPVDQTPSASRFEDVASNKRLLLVSALAVFIFFALYLGQPFAPNYLQEVVGVELSRIGFLGSAHALGAAVLGVALGRLSEGLGGFIVGQGLVLASLVIFLRTRTLPLLAMSFFLRGAFNACRSLALALTGRVVGATSVGLAYGVFNTAFNVSMVLAPYVAGWLYTAQPELPFLVSGIMIAIMMPLSFILLRDDGE